jgi:uncharacterized membrane protein
VKALIAPLRVRPRLLLAIAAGVATGLLLPGSLHGATRLLLAWNTTVWLYLAFVGALMRHPDHGHLRRQAAAHAESASVVLMIVVAAAVASMVAIFAELGAGKAGGTGLPWPQLLLTLATLIGSWLLLPFEFALTYASRYYAANPAGGGLDFPGMDESAGGVSLPNYTDFVYFSLTIAATAQTSDVNVTTRAMRRLVVTHGVVSFAFNTMVLALAINIAASLF